MRCRSPGARQDGACSTAFSIKSNLHAPWQETLAFATEGECLILIITLGYRDCVACRVETLPSLKLLSAAAGSMSLSTVRLCLILVKWEKIKHIHEVLKSYSSFHRLRTCELSWMEHVDIPMHKKTLLQFS